MEDQVQPETVESEAPKPHPVFENDSQRILHEVVLDILENSTVSKPMGVPDLMTRVKSRFSHDSEDLPIQENRLYEALKELVKLDNSPVSSKRGRNGGYFRSDIKVASRPQPDGIHPYPLPVEQKTQEEHLWAPVAKWLETSGHATQVTADLAHLKSGGKWGNPDVIGLEIVDDLGFFDVEVITAEVKPSLSNWRQFFFEAVSHSRFANRSFFIFRTAEDLDSEEKSELMKYAEKYHIGLVEIQLTDEDYAKLPGWKSLSDEDKGAIDNSFVEHYPAPFVHVAAEDKVAFLRRLGLQRRSDLYKFGKEA